MHYTIIVDKGNTAVVVKHDNDLKYYIPLDEANTDYQQYLAWLAEGNTPEEWNPNANQ